MDELAMHTHGGARQGKAEGVGVAVRCEWSGAKGHAGQGESQGESSSSSDDGGGATVADMVADPVSSYARSINVLPACRLNAPCIDAIEADCRGAHACHFMGIYKQDIGHYLASLEAPNRSAYRCTRPQRKMCEGPLTEEEPVVSLFGPPGDVPVGVPVGQSSEALRKEVALKRAELRAAELRLQLHELGASGPASPAA